MYLGALYKTSRVVLVKPVRTNAQFRANVIRQQANKQARQQRAKLIFRGR
jgi:hypothetical protein